MMTAAMRCLVLLSVVLALGGCSTVRVAYNQADHIAVWVADDYFDLTAEQKQALRASFERLHAWHRATQLPDYVVLLDGVQQRLSAGPTYADADWVADALLVRLRLVATQAYRDAALLLSQLSDEQLQAARREFDATNRKYARENGVGTAPEEQRRLLAKRQLERIVHWTGPLDAAQEAKVRELLRGLPLVAQARLQERQRRQSEFITLLAQRRNVEVFAPQLRDWLLDWERTRPAAYQAEHARYVKASRAMYVGIAQMLTPEQRSHVAGVVRRYQQAFRDLATAAPRASSSAVP